ncbi:unnamed protein product [Prunus armeniaca]|uniref:Cystatin domain-containing protein n=1 Tax=Prunus armeniaca TaxID=36596 RepID=A0A6J5XTJ5_PRUAR|nr:unnamed protein product [Prunus armeniaca]
MRGGAGWVAWDSNGCMEMAGGVRGFSCQSALAAEAEAVREAVAAGLEARVTRIMVEIDCKQLVAMLTGNMKTDTDTAIDGIIHDIKLLASQVEFAVSSYNKHEKKNLVFESVVKGKTRYEVTGLHIVLVIKVKDGSLPSANYDVAVRDKYAGSNPLDLIYFRRRPKFW